MGKIESFRGRPMYVDEKGGYRYVEDGVLVAESWTQKPCGFCGLSFTPEGHDGCLGELPGVSNACCGHGHKGEAYVQFSDGTRVSGSEALKIIHELKVSA